MNHTVKLPTNLNANKLSTTGIPDEGSWIDLSREKYLHLCRARDTEQSCSFGGWSIGLFAGGEVKLGELRYCILSIDTSKDKPLYPDEYAIPYDEAELVTIPCIYFDEDTECLKGEVIGFFKDGDCAVVKAGDMQVIKIDQSKVKYISDILEME